ncbi:MAG: TerD family protein [Clostridia bacterium]|jgi:tellurium resistance protein TerD|nr:TerD family protein [Clostridia bacterium]MEE1126232.1 TerD family protein [Acutalibacteraceae bacterium]
MGVNLTKGQRVCLEKSMTMALVGLGWDTNMYDGGADFDLDASAFMLGANGKVRKDEDFIFYGNLKSQDGSVLHTGDNLTGEGDGDDEVLVIDFTKIPADVQKIAITVTIYDAQSRRQNFGQVSNAYVRVARMANENDMNGTEVLKFDLVEEFSIETALVVCEIYRNGNDWKFNAVGAGYQGGLAALCRAYGVNV